MDTRFALGQQRVERSDKVVPAILAERDAACNRAASLVVHSYAWLSTIQRYVYRTVILTMRADTSLL